MLNVLVVERMDGGEMTVAMPNDVITNFLINPDYYIGGLVICKRDEFEKYEE